MANAEMVDRWEERTSIPVPDDTNIRAQGGVEFDPFFTTVYMDDYPLPRVQNEDENVTDLSRCGLARFRPRAWSGAGRARRRSHPSTQTEHRSGQYNRCSVCHHQFTHYENIYDSSEKTEAIGRL